MFELHLVFVALLVGTEAFFSGLSIKNLWYGARTARAEADWIQSELGVEDVGRLLDYQRLRTGFGLLRVWIGLGLTFLVLYTGLFAAVVEALEATRLSELLAGVAFFVGGMIAVRIFDVPFDLFHTFVVEELFDFNEQSVGLWGKDLLLSTLITSVLVATVSAAILWLIGTFSTWWWIGAVVFVGLFSLVMTIVYPRLIMPLFYDFEKIETGDLREGIEEVFERAGFSCEQIYEMNASSRSSKSNAFFIGFGRAKRVVLFDTLVESMEVPEVQGVLAHELAHWKKGHVWKQIGSTILQTAIVLFVVHVLVTPGYLVDTTWLYSMFGVPQTTYAGLVLAMLWVQPVYRLTSPIRLKLSLAHEREADAFAADVLPEAGPMADALAKLSEENLANPFPHPWFEAFHYDHPPIPKRIQALREREDDGVDSGETDHSAS